MGLPRQSAERDIMTPDFSEFSYGFAFTHEYIARNPNLVAAPDLPSLIDEANKGYDLKLSYQGHAKFFQFKLSTYLNRSNAIHWHCYHQPHYRIRVSTHARNNRDGQHTVLKRLASSMDRNTEDDVVYVAPKFHSDTEFNDLFSRGEVTINSIWAPVNDLPCVLNNSTHYMTFTKDQGIPWWHSEQRRLEGRFTAEEHYEMVTERITIDNDYFRDLRTKLINALTPPTLLSRGGQDLDQDILSVLTDTHRLLTTQFGLRMVILVEQPR